MFVVESTLIALAAQGPPPTVIVFLFNVRLKSVPVIIRLLELSGSKF